MKRTLLLQQAPFAQKFLKRVLPEGYNLESADMESVIKIQNKCHYLGRAYSIALERLGHDEKDKIAIHKYVEKTEKYVWKSPSEILCALLSAFSKYKDNNILSADHEYPDVTSRTKIS